MLLASQLISIISRPYDTPIRSPKTTGKDPFRGAHGGLNLRVFLDTSTLSFQRLGQGKRETHRVGIRGLQGTKFLFMLLRRRWNILGGGGSIQSPSLWSEGPSHFCNPFQRLALGLWSQYLVSSGREMFNLKE